MYHIKKDKKSQHSAKAICQGFTQCLQQKQMDIDKFTMSDIIKKANVGRATFYRLFDSKEDVLAYQCDLIIQKMHQIPKIDSTTQFMLKCFQVCLKNSLIFEAIFHSHREQIFYHSVMNKLHLSKSRFEVLKNYPSEQLDFFFSDLAYLLISTLRIWLQHGKRESARQLTDNIMSEIKLIHQLLEDQKK